MIVYIQGGTILNTQDSDCLPILLVTSHLLSSPQCSPCILAVPFQPDWLWSVTPRPTSSHKAIPPKRLKDKLNLMPCNKLCGLLCAGRYSVSRWRKGTFWSVWKSRVNMEPDLKHIWNRSESDNKCKIEIQVKHLQLQQMNSVNYVADRVCVRSHLRGDYEIQRVVEL